MQQHCPLPAFSLQVVLSQVVRPVLNRRKWTCWWFIVLQFKGCKLLFGKKKVGRFGGGGGESMGAHGQSWDFFLDNLYFIILCFGADPSNRWRMRRCRQRLEEEEVAAAPAGPGCNDPARPTQRPHLGEQRGLQMTDGGLLRQQSSGGLLENSYWTNAAASVVWLMWWNDCQDQVHHKHETFLQSLGHIYIKKKIIKIKLHL